MRDGNLWGYRLDGFEPADDPAWALSGLSGKLGFYAELARLGLIAKRAEMAAGLDADGRPMTPISRKTRRSRAEDRNPKTGRRPYSPYGRADPSHAALQATGPESRTQTLLRAEVTSTGVFFYWGYDFDTGRQWGEILARHARGFFVRFLDGYAWVPPRDLFGLGPRGREWVRRGLDKWWAANRRRLAGPALEGAISGRLVKAGRIRPDRPASVPIGKPAAGAPTTFNRVRVPLAAPKVRREEHAYSVVTMGVGSADAFGRPLRGRQKIYER
jgi:hypothetical protein